MIVGTAWHYQARAASPDNVAQLKSIADDAAEKATNTSEALESAQNEVIDSRDAVRETGEKLIEKQPVLEGRQG